MRAPLPGLLVEIQVSVGEHVKEQDVVAILESMKMNLELRAPRSGVIRQLLVGPGCQVAQDEVLVILGPDRASRGSTAG
jgi:3-methylcrotonyl-CoA carboxylase alpha subunit